MKPGGRAARATRAARAARATLVVVVGCLTIAATACSFDYGDSVEADAISNDVPTFVLTGFTYGVARDGQVLAQFSAARSVLFDANRRQIMDDVRFQEFDRDGAVVTEGRADRAVINLDTEDIELTGNIVFRSHSEDAVVEGSAFSWVAAERRLTSPADGAVSIEHSDGSRLSGVGFEADAASRTLRFSSRMRGTLNVDD